MPSILVLCPSAVRPPKTVFAVLKEPKRSRRSPIITSIVLNNKNTLITLTMLTTVTPNTVTQGMAIPSMVQLAMDMVSTIISSTNED